MARQTARGTRANTNAAAHPPSDFRLLRTWLKEPKSEEGERAFAEIYARYAKGVFACACKIVRPDAADDVAQDVFLTLKKQARGLCKMQHTSVCAWLYRVTYNTAVSYTRDWWGRNAITGAGGASVLEAQTDGGTNGPVGLLHAEEAARLAQFLAAQPREVRVLVDLKVKLQLKNTEIARVLRVSNSVITERLQNLRHKLYSYLGIAVPAKARAKKPAGDTAHNTARAVRVLAQCARRRGVVFAAVDGYVKAHGTFTKSAAFRLAAEIVQDAVIATFDSGAGAQQSDADWTRALTRSAYVIARARLIEMGCAIEM